MGATMDEKDKDDCVCCIYTQSFATPTAVTAGIIGTYGGLSVPGSVGVGLGACALCNLYFCWRKVANENEQALSYPHASVDEVKKSRKINPEPIKEEVKKAEK